MRHHFAILRPPGRKDQTRDSSSPCCSGPGVQPDLGGRLQSVFILGLTGVTFKAREEIPTGVSPPGEQAVCSIFSLTAQMSRDSAPALLPLIYRRLGLGGQFLCTYGMVHRSGWSFLVASYS